MNMKEEALKFSRLEDHRTNLTEWEEMSDEESYTNLTGIAMRFEENPEYNETSFDDSSSNSTQQLIMSKSDETTSVKLEVESTSTTQVSTTTVALTTLKTTTPKPTKTTTPTDFDFVCDELPGATGFTEDPYVCNKYIRCNHGKSQRFTCAAGTVWDSENKMCLWTESVDCAEREVEDEEGAENTDEDEDEEEEEEGEAAGDEDKADEKHEDTTAEASRQKRTTTPLSNNRWPLKPHTSNKTQF